MKRTLLLYAIICIISITTRAQYVTIPDAQFRSSLISQYPSCFNAAQQMDTTCSTIVNLQYFSFVNGGIKNFDGLQYFKSLQSLNWYLLGLDTIPAFPKSLKYITIYGNNLSKLPPLPDSLIELQVYGNYRLVSLPSLPSTLTILACNACHITYLPALPPSLKWLNCAGNNLTSLPPLPASLYHLGCEYNMLTTLPSLPNTMTLLSCSGNLLNGLPLLPDSLQTLWAGNINMSVLPPLPSGLGDLSISNNNLNSLPSNLPSTLSILNCGDNNLSGLPTLPSQLTFLNIMGNDNITCLPVLPITLQQLYIDITRIKCIPNSGAALMVYDSTNTYLMGYPICNAVNNINGCEAFPIMHGNVFYDLNNNGVKDSVEFYKRNGKVTLSNGAFTFTNANGIYELAADTIGSFTLAINPPLFFNAVPASIGYNFSTYDTVVTKNIALQPTLNRDSLSINITPLGARARPGFGLTYKVSYKNEGSTNLPATSIAIHYNNTLLSFDSSFYAVVTNTGNTLTLNLPSLHVGEYGDFGIAFTVNPAAPLGNTLITYATIAGGGISSVDTAKTIISGSFDPNDIQATPIMTTQQVNNGAFIDYTIRFQNTGTDTAFHIVIIDTLSNQLKTNTFELTDMSHNCKVSVNGNVATFEMSKILLPDHNVNESASHGFIRFRIKPVISLVAGNSVNNTAAIYFDFNSPVITNTAITRITSQNLPLKLISFKGKKIENGAINLYWYTNNEMNTKSFVIEQSTNTREFSNVAEVRAIGNGNNYYTHTINTPATGNLYFRLKMLDNDNTFSYSPIVLIRNPNKAGFVLNENPVKNAIQLTSVSSQLLNTEAILLNNIGAVVKRLIIRSSSQTITVNDLSSGIYYLKTVQGNEKVIISR